MLKIRYTKKAKSDLDGVFANIFQDKQDVAVAYIYKIREFITLLQSNPFMGIECRYKGFNRDCRVLIFENYLIQYKVFDDYVSIIRIRNSKQNLRRK
ncbi:MAG: type II toxin-antitoxin system RelE/ParE family toxin [Sulfurimonas sp.]|uniref:type II toxin-antitoxin system RelE/ParE family toxin n=1 Tax=Sulfurimonas sp. TaxID=2022749 RepID=UPI002618620B|nr:type II toxin-antitoxin system RelE/ParE family toxin [Sulfurimonas sp.]MDD5373848.1 type II toxin-antitoxin system RelE/ParE family toxin [Sulfurimonas sp.]